MAEVIPFRGIYYNTAKVSGGDVAAPPYDIITPEMRESLYGKSPFNIIRIDSGMELEGDDGADNKYKRAKEFMDRWLEEGILIRGERAFYAYEMQYSMKEEKKRVLGFFGLVRLEELGSGIYPHECTHSKPKKDRLTLLSTCGANTSPIFSLYRSPGRQASSVVKQVSAGKPYIEAKDMDCAVHRLWPITDRTSIEIIAKDLSDKAIYIADGHHRYETALQHRDETRRKNPGLGGDEPFNYVLMFLANMEDGGFSILPAHRLVTPNGDIIKAIGDYFDIERLAGDADIVSKISGAKNTFGLYFEKNMYMLRYGGDCISGMHQALRCLDVVILHEMILKNLLKTEAVAYEMNWKAAKSKVDEGTYMAAFFLNPTAAEEVERVALSGLRMPPKSTYFYPKVMTGFIINKF